MSQSIPLSADARERFLLEISAVVPVERISEVHFFPPMRQGQIETGVAVIAAMPEGAEPSPAEATVTADALAEDALAEDAEVPSVPSRPVDDYPEGASIPSRHIVYSARYRWTRKGPDRGKWQSEVVAEADAPLLTVEAVVQGVLRRAAEPTEAQKVDGDAVRAMILEAQRRWQTTP